MPDTRRLRSLATRLLLPLLLLPFLVPAAQAREMVSVNRPEINMRAGPGTWVYRPLTGKSAHHIVKVKVANIRSGPGTSSRVVGKAVYGEVLRTLERRQDWVKIRQDGGLMGWISRKLLWGW